MHPETELIPFLRGELASAEHERVAAHVAVCTECRGAIEESRVVLDALAARRPAPPDVDWGRYQAEVRAGVVLGVRGLQRVTDERRPTEVVAMDETALGAQLPLLREYRVVERLDMLEDLDVIGQLDRLGGG